MWWMNFKYKKETYYERVFKAFENFLLVFDVIDMLALDDVGLLHCLHCILVPLLALQPANPHVTEGA
jgi:hypothetical protein